VSDATGPGATVLARREALGLTRQDIADSLNLSVRVVEAIETENWRQLPGPAFIRGYLRAYAKLLEIDGEALTGGFDSHGGDGDAQAFRVVGGVEARAPRVGDLLQKHPGAVLSGAVALVICAVVVVLLAVWPEKARSPAPASTAGSDVTAPRQAVAAAKATPVEAAADVSSASSAAPVVAVASNVSTATPSTAPAVARSLTTKDPSGVRRITPTGDDRLSFSFSDDCWVEVKDAQGGSLFSDLGRAGGTLELIGHPPFHIVLGNAPAVTLLYNSEHVTLAQHTRNNVGTLVLGQ
jgi:cytoskeleton protein RodZ